jgi:uncharacterized membrane protein
VDATNKQAADGQPLRGREATIRSVFRWSLILKAIDSAIEMAAGVALYLVSHSAIVSFVHWLTRTELMEDPRDFLANMLMHSAEALSVPKKTAAAVYLLSHGAIKLFLVVMVLRGKNWAYPLFMAALVLLIAYQCYQIALAFSLWLAVLTVFDALVLILTWHEYGLHRRMKAAGG